MSHWFVRLSGRHWTDESWMAHFGAVAPLSTYIQAESIRGGCPRLKRYIFWLVYRAKPVADLQL
jgi:hypothetical protein